MSKYLLETIQFIKALTISKNPRQLDMVLLSILNHLLGNGQLLGMTQPVLWCGNAGHLTLHSTIKLDILWSGIGIHYQYCPGPVTG